jgi:hypothetical protein
MFQKERPVTSAHLNNIIYQALTIPTFRLIIFAESGF